MTNQANHPGVCRNKARRNRRGAVGRAIVHDDHLITRSERGERGERFVHKREKVLLLVMAREEEGELIN
jgi:hypothetical protein